MKFFPFIPFLLQALRSVGFIYGIYVDYCEKRGI